MSGSRASVRRGRLSHPAVFAPALALAAALCGANAPALAGSAAPALPACARLASTAAARPSGTWKVVLRTEADIPAALAAMTLAEKVGQMVQADVSTATPDDVREYGLGSVTDTVPAGDRGTTVAWRRLYDSYQRAALATRTGIPIVVGLDAVHGHAYFDGDSVILPHNIGLGATRNPALVGQLARVTARELSATGVRWTFSPTIAVVRDIRWGRTYESFGEDVELQRMFASALVDGYQGRDPAATDAVGATAKHFVADGATDGGVDRGDATIADAELRAMHLPGFVDAIDRGVVSVMASFSSVNGEKVHGSKRLLTGLLKEELGFDGVVITDWEGVKLANLTYWQSLDAGIDMFMLVRSWKEGLAEMIRLVKDGEVPMSRIDDAVTRILRMKLRLGLFDRPFSSAACEDTMGSREHRDLARQAVRESLVLLKNDGVLPLDRRRKVVVVGSHADNVAYQCGGWTKKWQGAHTDLYGHPARPVAGATSILAGIREVIGHENVVDAGVAGFSDAADVAIVVVGETPYAEGSGDRKAQDLVLTAEQRDLISRYHDAGKKVVVVLVSGRPLLVDQELGQSSAFVAAWLPGSEGRGIAEVLFGDYGFKGRLGFSWPRSAVQIPINVGDRDYEPLFPYGFGLTY
jgi:beta-glucosidase